MSAGHQEQSQFTSLDSVYSHCVLLLFAVPGLVQLIHIHCIIVRMCRVCINDHFSTCDVVLSRTLLPLECTRARVHMHLFHVTMEISVHSVENIPRYTADTVDECVTISYTET